MSCCRRPSPALVLPYNQLSYRLGISFGERISSTHIRSAAVVNKIVADKEKQQADSGAPLKAAFASTLGLSLNEAGTFLALATALDQQFAQLDAQAAAVIRQTRERRNADVTRLPAPPMLKELQKQKVQLMNTAVDSLTANLPDNIVSQVSVYLEKRKTTPAKAAQENRISDSSGGK